MIVDKKFTGVVRRGREPKYNFGALKPNTMLVIEPTAEDLKEPYKFRSRVGAALYQFKRYNAKDWETATRTDGVNIHVYRIK